MKRISKFISTGIPKSVDMGPAQSKELKRLYVENTSEANSVVLAAFCQPNFDGISNGSLPLSFDA